MTTLEILVYVLCVLLSIDVGLGLISIGFWLVEKARKDA